MKRHKEFKAHKLNRAGFEMNKKIRGLFDSLLTELEEICENGRELSIVKTKLE